MSDQLFDVVFFGIIQTGKDKHSVMQNMAKLFKTDAGKLAPYFAGGRKVIKGKINAGTAKKYKAALENVGLVIKIEACGVTPEEKPAAQTPPPAQSKSDAANKGNAGISMAAVGADIIENPVAVAAQKIGDISNITMAETGADVLENPVVVPAQKIADISAISLAEAGSDVLDQPREVIAQKIDDISGISMADVGADIIANPKAKEKADIPDTSALSLDDENK